ncbi:hypothetical protein ACWYXO_17895 [Janthinobacterium aestuarii]
MGIQVGTQLIAPNGYQMLEKDVTYYFLRSNATLERVGLVQYIVSPPRRVRNGKIVADAEAQYSTRLVVLPRCQFEQGLQTGEIVSCARQSTLPPWLARYEGIDLGWSDENRRHAHVRHDDRIDSRLKHIQSLLNMQTEILSSDNPEKAINKYARECTPVQNERRLRLWFLTYILFGQNRFALHYGIAAIGRWERRSAGAIKRGAPSTYKGKNHGYNVDEVMFKKIIEGFDRFARRGVKRGLIYEKALQYVFGCRIVTGQHRRKSYSQPDGTPYPSERQFFYCVGKEYGTSTVAEIKIGRGRARMELAPSKGSFTQAVSNLMECVEADGYFFEELPRGLIEGSPLPPLCEVRLRDVASGAIVGLGFSLGAERAAAYRMAMFCAAICKVKYCALHGVTIAPEEWPTIGLPSKYITDRGVGATATAFARDIVFKPAIRELTPSYSGQSKAVIESSHPKTTSNLDAPSYIQSQLTPALMIRREILATVRDNDCILAQSRLTPDLVDKVRTPTPIGLWEAMDRLGRNDAQRISFEDAVRNFLSKIPVKMKADGVFLKGRRYDSEHLRATKILEKVARSQGLDMDAYYLEGAARYIWIQVDGQLVELQLQLALRVQESAKNVSLQELQQWEAHERQQRSVHREHVHASNTAMRMRYEDETGKKSDGAITKNGRARRGTAQAKREAAEARAEHEGKDAR